MEVIKLKDGRTRVRLWEQYPVAWQAFAKYSVAEIREWCTSTFGKGGSSKKYKWRYGWIHDDGRFYFKFEEDAALFVLRWS